MSAVRFAHPMLVLRGLNGTVALRLDLHVLAVVAVMLLVTLGAILVALVAGDYPVGLTDLMRALSGRAEGALHMVVIEWRLPRALLAVVLGLALGLSGAIFQSLTRNPLGSPDVIGFSAGAYTGALIVMIHFAGNQYEIAGGAVGGGIATALAIYALVWQRGGGAQGFRLIIVGVGVSAMLAAVNTWMMLRAKLEVAMSAAVWGAGSLNGLGYERLAPAALIILGLLVPMLVLLARPMRQIEAGDDMARASGVPVERARIALVLVGVALAAVATAAAGPIAFVALAAPQIARRLTGAAGVALLPSAVAGALLLSVADLIAGHAFAPRYVPVGVVTVSIGGLYLVWLLIREARKQ